MARESLALIENQRQEAMRDLTVDPGPGLLAWGVAWLAGFGAEYFAAPQDHPGPALPGRVAVTVLLALFAVALAVSAGAAVRRRRGVAGPSRQASVMYGLSWVLGLAGLFAVNLGLRHHGLAPGLRPLVWSGSALLVVGLMYLAAGMLWSDRVQYGLGAWTLITGAASVTAGSPGNFAVLALAGGGGFLIAAAVSSVARRRALRARP